MRSTDACTELPVPSLQVIICSVSILLKDTAHCRRKLTTIQPGVLKVVTFFSCFFFKVYFVNSYFVNFPPHQLPISSTSHFVNSHFVNSYFVNINKMGIDKVVIDEVDERGIDKVEIDKVGRYLSLACSEYRLLTWHNQESTQ